MCFFLFAFTFSEVLVYGCTHWWFYIEFAIKFAIISGRDGGKLSVNVFLFLCFYFLCFLKKFFGHELRILFLDPVVISKARSGASWGVVWVW